MRQERKIREKTIHCGKGYTEVYIYGRGENDPPAKRNRRERISPPKQRNLNDKNARKYFVQLARGNFGKGDYHITCTYDEGFLPATFEDAEREAKNYMRRIEHLCGKKGLPPPKYLYITECYDKNGKPCRIHHHFFCPACYHGKRLNPFGGRRECRRAPQWAL